MFNQTLNVFYIPKSTNFVIVSDMFSSDYSGGAELTLEAILESSPEKIFKIHSSAVTTKLIEDNQDKYWILGNFSNLSQENIITLVNSSAKFSIIECDYKYCKYRSSHLHELQEKIKCDCHKKRNGLFIREFYKRAQHVFFMSEEQMKIYMEKFPKYENNNFHIQSSTFRKNTLDMISNLRRENKNSSSDVWAVLGGGSWIKAQEQTVKYCQDHGIKFEIVGGLKHEDFLDKLSGYKGIVFLPAGYDTAPRVVIESKLLGLEYILNENVQHRNEKWFTGSIEDCEKYLITRPKYFWKIILNDDK